MFSQTDLIDAMTRLGSAASAASRWDCGKTILRGIGSDWVTAGTASRAFPDAVAIRTSTPDALMRDYLGERMHLEDPWMAHCATCADIETTDVAHAVDGRDAKLGARQARLFAAHGVYRAMLVPSYGGARPGGIVLYARSSDAALWMDTADGRARIRLATAVLSAYFRPEHDTSDSPERYALPSPLSARECEVLQWLSCGLLSAGIAERMGIEQVTVGKHLRSVRRKLGARTREQALAIAVRDGLVTL